MEKKIDTNKTTIKALHTEIHTMTDRLDKDIQDLLDLHKNDLEILTGRIDWMQESFKDDLGSVYKLIVTLFILVAVLFTLILV